MKRKPTFSIFSMVLFVCLAGSPISSSAGGSDYYVVIDGEQKGPMATEQLENLKQDGMLTSDTLVWKDGMAEWGKAGEQEDLKTLFAAVVTPPAPPPTPSTPPPPPTPGSEGQQAGSGEDVSETVADTSEAPIELSASGQVREAAESYAQAKGIEWGVSGKGGKIYYFITASVEADPNSKSWAKARYTAFQEALLDAQATFIRDQFGTQTVSIGKTLFEDQSDDAEEFERKARASGTMGQLQAISTKVLAVGDAVLSDKLRELGVDSTQFDAAPESEKKITFMKTITETAMVRAVGSISGLVPIQTFEGRSESDEGSQQHTIGVILMFSPKLKQLASDIANRRVPLLRKTKGKGRPVKEFIPKKKNVLVNQFGIRVGFDENNIPFLVSYGQWSYLDEGLTERKKERRRESARATAESKADAQLTMFLAGRLSYGDEHVTGSHIAQGLEGTFNPDGSVSTRPIDIEKMIDKTNKKIEANATANLAGRSTILPMWLYKHEYGQEIVGVVRAWTLAGAQANEKLKNWEAELKKDEKKKEVEKKKSKAGVKSGKDQMDTDDF